MLCSYVSCIITTQSLINLIAASVEMELILQLDLTGLSFLPELQLQIKSQGEIIINHLWHVLPLNKAA